MRIGKVLADWRYANRLTVRNAAKQVGIQYSTLSRIEGGESPSGETLAAILKWLLEETPADEKRRKVEVL